ncbi:MAG: hypothetical protein IKJ68_08090 [Clostridia bacterium]|nr:hypothetical protein [Clostridia bacterium]
MNKNFTKLTSIFVLIAFIISALSCNVMASLSYNTSKWGDSMPWTGDDTPYARAVSSAGTPLNTSFTNLNVEKYPIIESQAGIYGKEASDEIYKTYDSASRTGLDYTNSGFEAVVNNEGIETLSQKDLVLSFSFAYDKAATNPDGLLVRSYVRTNDYSKTERNELTNLIAVRTDGVRISDTDSYYSSNIKNSDFYEYNFESGKWYTLDFVFDFENKELSSDANLQEEYKWSVYVNGTKLGETTVTLPHYRFQNSYLKWYPAQGVEMYWDNINIYTTDATTFESPNTGANLTSTDNKIVLSDSSIKLGKFATVGDVKAAVEESLAENEEIRVYNSDYSAVLADTESAFETNLVVIGNGILDGETEARETVYTYYDVNADGYFFEEPSIAINGTTATGSVKLYNYSAETQEFNVYLAVYKGSELVALNASDNELVAGADETVVSHTTPAVDLLLGDKVKLFVWDKDTIVPELKTTEKSYTIAGEYNPACADLKSITLPMGVYNGNYNEIGFLYPTFDKDITEYDVYTYTSGSTNYKPLSGFDLELATVNSAAKVARTTDPDTALAETAAVYTVTSADGNVTKDYKINYHSIEKDTNSLAITGYKNGLDNSTGSYIMWGYRLSDTQIANNILIQDGTFANGSRKTQSSRPIIEIDIENGPDEIDHGILTLTNVKNIGNQDSEYDSGKLKVYKINDSIYNAVATGGLAGIGDTETKNYFGDEMCSVGIGALTAKDGDMYFINIDASYYNSLKAAEKTKMYIGLAGEADNGDTMALGVAFGRGGTGDGNSRFNYITK